MVQNKKEEKTESKIETGEKLEEVRPSKLKNLFSKIFSRKKKNFETELKNLQKKSNANNEQVNPPVYEDSKSTALGVAFLRWGMSMVFLYFGINQLMHPERFIGWLPKEAALVPLAPKMLIIINGSVEVFFGILILLGIYTRISALILGLHLGGITATIGFTEIGVRDLGLTIASLVLALTGPGSFSLSSYLKDED